MCRIHECTLYACKPNNKINLNGLKKCTACRWKSLGWKLMKQVTETTQKNIIQKATIQILIF